MVRQTEGAYSLVRSVPCRECGPLKAGACRDGGRTEHQQRHRKGEHCRMIRAYRLYTGSDGNSHVVRGSVSGGELVEAESIEFKETPAHSSFELRNDPTTNYVITLSRVLEFTRV